MEQDNYNLLLRSFDFELTAEETDLLETALKNSQALRKEKEELLATRALLANWQVPEDPNFSDAVMNRISEIKHQVQNNFSHSIVQLFPRLAAACVVFILIMLVNTYVADGSLSSEAVLGVESLYLEEANLTDLGF